MNTSQDKTILKKDIGSFSQLPINKGIEDFDNEIIEKKRNQ